MKWITLCTAALFLMTSCDNKKETVANTDIGVAQAFVENLLKNDFKDAQQYIVEGDNNKQYFEMAKANFESKSKEELDHYKDAEIIINQITPVNDSTSIVDYSNSYKKDVKTKLKMVKINGKWLVDLQYTL